eukprot:scaffold137131_cov24-Tisochrysis_lutea.AAC.1
MRSKPEQSPQAQTAKGGKQSMSTTGREGEWKQLRHPLTLVTTARARAIRATASKRTDLNDYGV